MSSASYYKWRSKCAGMEASLMVRLKELEIENKWLKKMQADVQLDAEILRKSLAKKW